MSLLQQIVIGVSVLVIGGVFSEDPLPINLPENPPQVSFNISEKGNYCLMVRGGFRFAVNYTNSDNKEVTRQLDIPVSAKGTGSCGSNDQKLIVSFLDGWSATFNFKRQDKEWFMNEVNVSFVLTESQQPFPDVKGNISSIVDVKNLTKFQTAVNSSYQCIAAQSINFTKPENVFGLDTYQLQVQAFHSGNSSAFDNPVGCPADQVSNIVPIAVGAALGALVIVVLIAYFIGRSRNKRGYESV